MKLDNPGFKTICRQFERIIVLVLMVLMMIAVFFSAVDVVITIGSRIISPPFLRLDASEILGLFGVILMVVIGLELLETIKAFFENGTVHVETVLLVAVVAVARKIIIMDYADVSPLMILAISALVLALSAGFFIVNRALTAQSEREKE
ncbi:MAG: phosphate-starvation-inducible E-like protein [Kiritimatiellaceae bacterium]|nr:phosphate-starvation-inducible E-like protein [Kiritimatiellaceae bacterium]